MSIWCSRHVAGVDDEDHTMTGTVVAFAEGFSNHYPESTDPPASIGVASIPPWCGPGHDNDTTDERPPGPWLRLDVDSPRALSWWGADPAHRPTPAPVHASVVLDETAARALAAALIEWADRPKTRPNGDNL